MKKQAKLNVVYPAEFFNEDDLVRKAVGQDEDGAGLGFGERDMDFTVDVAKLPKIEKQLDKLKKKLKGLSWSCFEPEPAKKKPVKAKKIKKKNPNTNCLAGMKCPICSNYGPFYIQSQCITLVHDDGTETDYGDTEWNADSYCKCYECKHAGTVEDFTEE